MHCTRPASFALALAAALPLMTLSAPAQAELSGNIALTSNYKFRGQDQHSDLRTIRPALSGGVEYTFGESGWYVGNWNSTVHWLDGNDIEVDFYGGYRFKAAGADWDVGGLLYLYPGNTTGNTSELYASATWGGLTAKYSHTVSKDYFGWAGHKSGSGLKGTNTGYFNLAYSHEVTENVTFDVAVGHTRFSSDIRGMGVPSYTDYSVGGSYAFSDGFSLAAAIVGADKRSYYGDGNKPRVIVTLSKDF